MNKKTKGLVILVAVMLVCVAGYLAISRINFDKEEEDTSVSLFEGVDAEDVTAFAYDAEGVQYSFSKMNDVWYCDTELSKELDQDKIGHMLAILTGFKSERALDVSKADFAEYGLENPFKTVMFTTVDGVKHTLVVGDRNINSQYYAYKDDESMVYTIDATINTYFGYTLADIEAAKEADEASKQ